MKKKDFHKLQLNNQLTKDLNKSMRGRINNNFKVQRNCY